MTIRFTPKIELYYDSQWNDITNDVRVSDGVSIRRGRSDEASNVDPGSCSLTLDNTDGKYSPRNPLSPLYGKIGRNTPIRISEGTPAGTPTTAVSDLFTRTIVNGWGTSDTGQKWRTQGGVYTDFNTNGTKGTILCSSATFRWCWVENSMADCETLFSFSTSQVATGAALSPGAIFRYYTASPNHKYYRVRADLNTDGSIALNVTHGLTVLGTASTSTTYVANTKLWMRARVEGHRVRGKCWADGSAEPGSWQIDVTVTDDVIDGGAVGFITSFLTGNTNTNYTWSFDDLTITELDPDEYRFIGEVANWPARWDVSGKNIYTTIEASGILRRLGQGASPLRSAYYRELTSAEWHEPFVAYWPMEDGDGSTQLAPAIGGIPMTIKGVPSMGAFDGFAASDSIPTMGSATFYGTIPGHAATGEFSLRHLIDVPTAGLTDLQHIVSTYFTGGTVGRIDLQYGTISGGSVNVRFVDTDGTLLGDTGFIAFTLNGKKQNLGIRLTQNGANIDYEVGRIEILSNAAIHSVFPGTFNSNTFGRATRVVVAPQGGLTEASIGHLTVSAVSDTAMFLTKDWMHGWSSEPAGVRMRRLCAEEGVPFVSHRSLWDTELMGPQRGSKTFLDLLKECSESDGGFLGELRSQLGLTCVPRTSMYNQAAAATLSYSSGHVSEPFEPEEDDANIRNDITVDRELGSSARSIEETGRMSVSAPPDGVGRYDESVTLSLSTDEQCLNQASWRRHLGTWDDLRYPSVTVDLAKNPSLEAAVTALDSGKIVAVTGLPSWLPPDAVNLMVQGYSESLDQYHWDVTFNTTPGGLWYVFEVADQTYGRLDTSGSYLVLDITSTATSITVATEGLFAPWITTANRPGDFPFNIKLGGEVVTVTAITGAVSPQTFTVTRSVNGIVKSHLSGTRVQIAR